MPITSSVHSASSETMKLTKAILFYQGSQQAYATVNEVINMEDGSQALGAGIPATIESVGELAALLVNNIKMGGFLPETVLSVTPNTVTWWCKPYVRQIYFNCADEKIGKRTAKVPCPGLVFRVGEKGWSVFAVKGNSRPTPETKLYQAPFFNVWSNGSICTGNVLVPDSASQESITEWERAFFMSYFSHPNVHAPQKLVHSKKGSFGFWKDMLDGVHNTFPASALVETGATLLEYLEGSQEAR